MGFGILGHPSGELTEENIKFDLKVYFNIWLKDLNFENYQNTVFGLDLKIHSRTDTKSILNENVLIEKKRNINNHIFWELKSLNGLTKWIESIFDFYGLDKYNLQSYKNQFEVNDKNLNSSKTCNLISSLKNQNHVSVMKESLLIHQKINGSSKSEILYFCIIMYLDFLNIEEFLDSKFDHSLPKEIKLQPKTKNLSINQIALKLVYEGASLPRDKAMKIINDYGHSSGEKLFQRFTFYSKGSNRRANPAGTIKILENKINLFESVIELLPNGKKSKAFDEVKHLKGFLGSLE